MEIKDRIIQGAQELFFKYGIKSITMDDIAKHLGVSKKTLYLYFADKNEIVVTLMKQSLQQDRCEFEQIHTEAKNMIEEVMLMMRHITQMFAKINPTIFYDLQKYHPDAWKQFHQFKRECMAGMIEKSIERGKREGYVRPDVNSKVLSRMRVEMVEMGLNPDVFPPNEFKLMDVQIAILDHFLHGITTIKGHRLINKHKNLIEEE
jgi:TetR/AcrR family transcriptional regulator, cholesterol catabolism regulator